MVGTHERVAVAFRTPVFELVRPEVVSRDQRFKARALHRPVATGILPRAPFTWTQTA